MPVGLVATLGLDPRLFCELPISLTVPGLLVISLCWSTAVTSLGARDMCRSWGDTGAGIVFGVAWF